MAKGESSNTHLNYKTENYTIFLSLTGWNIAKPNFDPRSEGCGKFKYRENYNKSRPINKVYLQQEARGTPIYLRSGAT